MTKAGAAPMLRNQGREPSHPPRRPSGLLGTAFGEAIGGMAMLILGGVAWLVVTLPVQLNKIKLNQRTALETVSKIVEVQEKHDSWLREHERRLIREETLSREPVAPGNNRLNP